jgi:hypothetical protein
MDIRGVKEACERSFWWLFNDCLLWRKRDQSIYGKECIEEILFCPLCNTVLNEIDPKNIYPCQICTKFHCVGCTFFIQTHCDKIGEECLK